MAVEPPTVTGVGQVGIEAPRTRQSPGARKSPSGARKRNSTAAWCFNRSEFEELDAMVGPFSVDICAAPNNAQVPRHYTRASSCLAQDLSGETVWCNPPWVGLAEIVQHYKACKMRSPATTSAVFVVPAWDAPWVREFRGWTLLRSYPKGVRLFTLVDDHGNRSWVGPTPWPVNVFWDPKEGETRKPQISLGCSPLPDGRVTRTLEPSKQLRSQAAAVEEGGKRRASGATPACEAGVVISAAASSVLLGVPPTVLRGKVNGHEASVMLDSGARADLMDISFTKKLGLEVQAECQLGVEAFDGRPSGLHGVVQDVSLELGDLRCVLSFLVVDLKHFDIYLGTGWHQKYNPQVTWNPRRVRVSLQDGVRHCLPVAKSPEEHFAEKVPTISAMETVRLVRNGQADLYICEILPVDQESPEWQERLKEVAEPFTWELITLFKGEFDPVGKPVFKKYKMRVRLVEGAEAPKMRTAKTNSLELQEIKAQLIDHLEKEWIRPSSSEFGAAVLFVRKKDGTLRMCQDYRALNRITVKDRYPLPYLEELMDQLCGAKIFSKIDLQSGYHQIQLEEEDRHKTAFCTRYGHYEFNVVPFGLSNAPSVFMRIMHNLFEPYLDEFVVIFIDDIMVYSKTEEEHLVHLRKVLQVLKENGLKAKLTKCAFGRTRVEFVGHMVSEKGVEGTASYVQALREWETPTDKEQVKQFLGLVNWVSKYIPRYAEIALPMSDLLSSRKGWTWTSVEQAAFDGLKDKLAEAPVLIYPNVREPFVLIADASDHTVGGSSVSGMRGET